MNRKIKIGLIVFIIGGIFLIIGLMPFLLNINWESPIYALILFLCISPVFLLVGPVYIISGLNPRNQGIAFIGIGIIICLFATSIISSIIQFNDIIQDVAIILYLFNLLWWSLIFIIPGIMLIKYEKIIMIYFILDLLIITTLMWKAILIIIFSSFSELNFGDFFLLHFWEALGLGFIFGLITTGLAYLFQGVAL